MGLSLRDLAERSGVSAPMLSQVERGETSPTLAVAAKIAAGLELTPVPAAAPRRGRARGRRSPRRGPQAPSRRASRRGADAAAAGPARRRLAAPSRAPAPPQAARAIRRSTSPAAVRPRWSSAGAATLVVDGEASRAGRGRQRHLRRRPRRITSRTMERAGRAPGGGRGGPRGEADDGEDACSTRSGTPTRSTTA